MGDFAQQERPKLLAEIGSLRTLIVQYLAWSDAAPGTYQAVPVAGAIIRLDTRTGTFERCTVGDVVTCVTVASK